MVQAWPRCIDTHTVKALAVAIAPSGIAIEVQLLFNREFGQKRAS